MAAATNNWLNLASLLFHVLPKNLISWVTGAAARLRLPGPLNHWALGAFARTFKLNMAEARDPLSSFATIEDLFIRHLKPGLRPLAGPVCSPADGYLARSAPVTDGACIQAKGLDFTAEDLVFGDGRLPEDPRPDFAWFTTVYLAPHNYHRVHAPFAGRLTAIRHLPGDLWPVNKPFVARIPRLFARNERLVFDFALEGGGLAYVVMVGAMNVGRMITPFLPHLITNDANRQLGGTPMTHRFSEPPSVALGQELGAFLLGSTVVIAYDREAASRFALARAEGNAPILLGQSLLEKSP